MTKAQRFLHALKRHGSVGVVVFKKRGDFHAHLSGSWQLVGSDLCNRNDGTTIPLADVVSFTAYSGVVITADDFANRPNPTQFAPLKVVERGAYKFTLTSLGTIQVLDINGGYILPVLVEDVAGLVQGLGEVAS